MGDVDKWLARLRDILIIIYLMAGLLLFIWWINAFILAVIGG